MAALECGACLLIHKSLCHRLLLRQPRNVEHKRAKVNVPEPGYCCCSRASAPVATPLQWVSIAFQLLCRQGDSTAN
ncbi:hypothetical protein AOLI_G00239590 [Acnodon oligacanthus]